MGDVDKPFACSEPGCGMKFTNEDHLNVHKQKHMMSLALNSTSSGLSNFLFADQTPTPTKFLKNCDDIGLFQELSKNPFEESFKKAASEFTKDSGGIESVDTPTIPQRGDDMRSVMDSPLPGPQLLRTPSITVTDTTVSSEPETVLQPSVVASVPETDVPTPVREISPLAAKSNKTEESPSAIRPTSLVQSGALALTTARPLTQSSVTTFTETITQSHVGPSTTPLQQATSPLHQRLVPLASDTTVQVLLTLPGGASIPVQIPATAVVSNASPTAVKQNVLPAAIASHPVIMPVAHTLTGQLPLNLKMNTVTKAAASSSTSAFTKQKLKEALSQNAQNNILKENMRVMSEAVDQVTSGHSGASTPESMVDTTTAMIAYKRRSGSTASESDLLDDADPEAKRQKFLARNRAAAQRCRDKRKTWINSLEGKADDLNAHNTRLQNEVKSLRDEVAKLKSILLEHKDCPITLQQQARGDLQAALGSTVVSVAPTLQNASTSAPMARLVPNTCANAPQKILILPSKAAKK